MKAKEILIADGNHLKGSYKDDRAQVFLVVAIDTTRRPKETLNLERFRLEIRTHKKIIMKKKNNTEAGYPIPGHFQNSDKTIAALPSTLADAKKSHSHLLLPHYLLPYILPSAPLKPLQMECETLQR